MYKYEWDIETGGYILTTNVVGVSKELRPVFYEELDLLGFRDHGWDYPKTDKPLMWAETRRYIYRGELVAEAVGGGLYTKPEIRVHQVLTNIEPVNVEAMIAKNKPLMTGLIQNTVETIYKTYNKYKNKVDVVYVAFSGGKDSLVLLDLVQKALPRNGFKVIFGDTSMEVSDTYKAIEKVKERYPELEIITAKSHLNATDTWNIFGPPSKTIRWCCAVHKSAPSLLKLRELTNMSKLKALAFDGVRAEESESRATYSIESVGTKHTTQINCSPILNWGTSELFLYIFDSKLMLNDAYRYGSNRVGCALCPMSSGWRDFITKQVYQSDIEEFESKVISYSRNVGLEDIQLKSYIESGGWRNRAGGRGIEDMPRIIIQTNKNVTRYIFNKPNEIWKEWIKTIGTLTQNAEYGYLLNYNGKNYQINLLETENTIIEVIGSNNANDDKRFNYCIKSIFNKAAYCVGCKACIVECLTGAISMNDGEVKISKDCVNCEKCLEIRRGCLVAKSLYTTLGGTNMSELKGVNRYGTFGFRKEWLKYLKEFGDVTFWQTDKLGPDQFDGFRKWLIDAEICDGHSLSSFGKELLEKDLDDINVWGFISINLSYRSVIFNWYISNIEFNVPKKKTDYIDMLGDCDEKKKRTWSNALNSLINTFVTSPIGVELGMGVYAKKGKTVDNIARVPWDNPHPLVILYSVYKFAEKCDGHYNFTLSYLCDDTIERNGISPSTIFGLDKDTLKQKLQHLSTDYKDFIVATFNKDLDNIDLNKEKTSLDVLKLF